MLSNRHIKIWSEDTAMVPQRMLTYCVNFRIFSTEGIQELERFNSQHLADFKSILVNYVQLQMHIHRKVCMLPSPPLPPPPPKKKNVYEFLQGVNCWERARKGFEN